MSVGRATLALSLVAACSRTSGTSASGPRDARGQDDAAMTAPAPAATTATPSPEFSATVTAEVARRPPVVELRLDLRLHNPSGAPRWYLVPRDVDQPIGGGGVDVLEPMRWTDAADGFTVGAFQGTGGFFALLLGPGAAVELRGLGLRWFRDGDAPRPTITAIATPDLTIGGRPAAAWFPTPPLITGARRGERGEVAGTVRFQPDSREVAVDLGAASRVPLAL